MSFFVRQIPDYEMCPRGFGVAWYDYYAQRRTVMPLGINYLAGVLRRVKWFIGKGFRSYELAELRHENEMLKNDLSAAKDTIRLFMPKKTERGTNT